MNVILVALRALTLRDWIIVGLLVSVVAYNWGLDIESARADRAEAKAAQLQSKHDLLVANLKAAQDLADIQQKEHKREMQERVAQARQQERAAAAANESRLRAAVAAERADARSLRAQLAERLREPARAGADPAAAGDDVAAAVGDVLAEALRVQAELAAAAERHAAEVRALLDAWPSVKGAAP